MAGEGAPNAPEAARLEGVPLGVLLGLGAPLLDGLAGVDERRRSEPDEPENEPLRWRSLTPPPPAPAPPPPPPPAAYSPLTKESTGFSSCNVAVTWQWRVSVAR